MNFDFKIGNISVELELLELVRSFANGITFVAGDFEVRYNPKHDHTPSLSTFLTLVNVMLFSVSIYSGWHVEEPYEI